MLKARSDARLIHESLQVALKYDKIKELFTHNENAISV